MDEIKSEMAKLIYNVLSGSGHKIRLYDENGKEVFDPEKANRIWSDSQKMMVVLGKSQGSPSKPLVTFYTSSVTDPVVFNDFKTAIKRHNIYDYSFDTQPYGKILEPRHFKHMNVTESWSGTTKTSYFPIDKVNVVIRHNKSWNKDQIDSAQRWRRIKQILLFTPDGQRFKFPFNNISGARAMAQHLNQPDCYMHDTKGTLIQDLGKLLYDLKSIQRKSKNLQQWDLLNHITDTRKQIKSLLQCISQENKYASGIDTASSWLQEWRKTPWKTSNTPSFKEAKELNEWFSAFEPKTILENQEKIEQVYASDQLSGGDLHMTIDILKRNWPGWEQRYENDPRSLIDEVTHLLKEIYNRH